MVSKGNEFIDILGNEREYNKFKLFLNICGVCIDDDRHLRLYLTAVMVNCTISLMILTYSIYYYIDDMGIWAVAAHHETLVLGMAIANGYTAFVRNRIRDIIARFRLSYNYDSEILTKFREELKVKRMISLDNSMKCLIASSVYVQISIIIFSFIERYSGNKTHLLLFQCWLPFELDNIFIHMSTYLYQVFLFQLIVLIIHGSLGMLVLLWNHLTFEISLLEYALEKSEEMAVERLQKNPNYNEKRFIGNDRDSYENMLRYSYITGTTICAKHHQDIIEIYNWSRDLLKVYYTTLFAGGLILLTTTGFVVVYGNIWLKIKFIGLNIIQFSFLYLSCWIADNLTERGENIRLVIYGIEWYKMPKESQSTLKIMTERTMRPMGFVTHTGQNGNIENYMTMVKASYSYFNMMVSTK